MAGYNIVYNQSGTEQPYTDNTLFFDTNGLKEVHVGGVITPINQGGVTQESFIPRPYEMIPSAECEFVDASNTTVTFRTRYPVKMFNFVDAYSAGSQFWDNEIVRNDDGSFSISGIAFHATGSYYLVVSYYS